MVKSFISLVFLASLLAEPVVQFFLTTSESVCTVICEEQKEEGNKTESKEKKQENEDFCHHNPEFHFASSEKAYLKWTDTSSYPLVFSGVLEVPPEVI